MMVKLFKTGAHCHPGMGKSHCLYLHSLALILKKHTHFSALTYSILLNLQYCSDSIVSFAEV